MNLIILGLSSASKNVNKNTATLVATVKDVQQSLQSDSLSIDSNRSHLKSVISELLDFSSLSLHEAKKEEMESQIRTLELESELSRERARLASLRKLHYHLASLVAEENGETKEPEAQSDQR